MITEVTDLTHKTFFANFNRFNNITGGDGWLQNSLVSASPTGDLIVFAREKRLVVSSGRWDNLN